MSRRGRCSLLNIRMLDTQRPTVLDAHRGCNLPTLGIVGPRREALGASSMRACCHDATAIYTKFGRLLGYAVRIESVTRWADASVESERVFECVTLPSSIAAPRLKAVHFTPPIVTCFADHGSNFARSSSALRSMPACSATNSSASSASSASTTQSNPALPVSTR